MSDCFHKIKFILRWDEIYGCNRDTRLGDEYWDSIVLETGSPRLGDPIHSSSGGGFLTGGVTVAAVGVEEVM